MRARRLIGRHSSGEMGVWVSREGFDALTDDRTDRAKFKVSTSFPGRVPFRIMASGLSKTATPIYLPSNWRDLGEPILSYRIMLDSQTERENGVFYNGVGSPTYSGSEFQSRFYPDASPSYFLIQIKGSENSNSAMIRYTVFLV